jgi:hypothetical protein
MPKSTPGPIVLYASAARTTTPAVSTAYRRQGQYRGGVLQINVTAETSTPSVVFTLQQQSASTYAWSTIVESAAISTVSTVNIVVHPSAPDIANLSESTQMGNRWRLIATHGNSDSITYTATWFPIA